MTPQLIVLPGRYAVCRLDPDSEVPVWATGKFVTITRTREELSIVCEQHQVPSGIPSETGWRCVRVAGTLDFSLTGVIASLTQPLADAEISVFVVSTFDTDYALVKEDDLQRATNAWHQAGL